MVDFDVDHDEMLSVNAAYVDNDRRLTFNADNNNDPCNSNTDPITQAHMSNIAHGGSVEHGHSGHHSVKFDTRTKLNLNSQMSDRYDLTIGDKYLAGKVLIDSGGKVRFDGNPKNYIAFRKGIDRILSIYGPQHGLVYDILQSRCTGKASEAIRFCDRIQNPSIALETALNRLEKFFGDPAVVVEAQIDDLAMREVFKWKVDSFQSFLNELENIKSVLNDDAQKLVLNSCTIKEIVARLPKTGVPNLFLDVKFTAISSHEFT